MCYIFFWGGVGAGGGGKPTDCFSLETYNGNQLIDGNFIKVETLPELKLFFNLCL